MPSSIDAVITWVDGDALAHRAKREHYLAKARSPLHQNGVNPQRWTCSDELRYCLRSIANHAPWLRTIWIVTDDQTPDLDGLPLTLRARIRIVDHRVIFAGYEDALPTFNSLAIETMLWRIPGLAPRFIYLNDDVFLTAPLSPADVFHGDAPVLRGRWVDYSDLLLSPSLREEQPLINHFNQLNAAMMLGFAPAHLFASAHVVHPMRRDVLAQLFDDHRDASLQNIRHRFRDVGQFLAQALHNHACIRDGAYALQATPDHVYLRTGAIDDHPVAQVRDTLRRASAPGCKFFCINDLPQVEAVIPDTRAWIERAIGARDAAPSPAASSTAPQASL